jgi:hypothetical protein
MHECGITSEEDSLSQNRASQVCWESKKYQIQCYHNITRAFPQKIQVTLNTSQLRSMTVQMNLKHTISNCNHLIFDLIFF